MIKVDQEKLKERLMTEKGNKRILQVKANKLQHKFREDFSSNDVPQAEIFKSRVNLFKAEERVEDVNEIISILEDFISPSEKSVSMFNYQYTTWELKGKKCKNLFNHEKINREDNPMTLRNKISNNGNQKRGEIILNTLKFIEKISEGFDKNKAKIKHLIDILRTKKVGIIKSEIDKDYIILSTVQGSKIKIPRDFSLSNDLARVCIESLEMEDFRYLERYLNNNLTDRRLHAKMKKKNEEKGTRFLPLKKFEVLSKGFYFVLGNGKYEQPLMVDWDGKILKRKQGINILKYE